MTTRTSSFLPAEPLTLDQVEYDFENYALEHGIPETLDPLPYRKTGSVFGNTNEAGGGDNDDANAAAEPVLTSAKHDPRLRTVVCRHWLRDLCMKGSACEFLHQFDLKKMPLCRYSDRCKIPNCPFRHIAEADRMHCVFYQQGFCIHGSFCRYKHERKERIDLPAVANFTLGLSQMQQHNKDQSQQSSRRPASQPNQFFKISLCKHFMAGDCPFGESCHFAHGMHELRAFPGRNNNDDDNNVSDNMFQTQAESSTVDYFQGGASGGGKPMPIIEPDKACFFILCANSQRDLALSTVHREWYVQRRHAEQLNGQSDQGRRQVLLFFTVHQSQHIQGAALLKSTAKYVERADKSSDKDPFCYRIEVEWFRTTEMPISTALEVAPDLLIPTSNTQFCLDMTPSTGESLMKALWNSPLVTLYEAWGGLDDEERAPPAAEDLLTDFRAPAPHEVAWPVMPGPGFIFGCNSDTMDECLGRGLFGLPSHMKAAASSIRPGQTIFLFNITDRLMFGIFEALTPAHMNMVPQAFSKNPKATSSPFPVQIRVRVSLECPPLEDTDAVLNDILRGRGSGRIGSVTHAQTQAIASMLAQQCGALAYMVDHQAGRQRGERVRAPPIALPPKTIRAAAEDGSAAQHAPMDTTY